MAPRVFSEADFAPRVFSEADFAPVEPVNAEGNTYQEAMYGDAAPTATKIASGALGGIASIADLPELLGGLAYKYNPLSSGFLQETPQEKFQNIVKSLQDSGQINNLTPDQLSELKRMERVINEPELGLGDKVRAGFDWATGIENSTQVAPDSIWHKVGEYAPYVINPTGLLTKAAPKVLAKGAAQTALVASGGYGGREVDKALGGSGIAGEMIGSTLAAFTPSAVKKIAKAGVDDIESLLIGNDKNAKARLIGGLDKDGNFTTKARDIAVQVSKKDLLAKDLKDSGFWDNITPTDTPSSFSRKLSIFKDDAGATLGGLLDEASRAQVAGKMGPSTLNLSRARQYADEIATVDKTMGKKFHLELDDLEASFNATKGGIDDLNNLRANWGQRYPKSFSANKTTEDLVRDSFNKDVYADFRQSVDRSAENIGARAGKPTLASDIKNANRAYHAATGLENAAFNVQRGGVRGRLRKDVFNARDLIRMGALAGAGAAGAPVAGTVAAIDFARSAAKDIAPIQTRAALKGVGAVADIFDPLTRLTAGGVAGSKAAGEGKYIATPGAKFTPKMLPPPAEPLGIEYKPLMEGGVTGPSYPFKPNLGNIKDNLADMSGSGATDIPIFSLGKKTTDPRLVAPKVAKKVNQLIEVPEGYRARTAEEIGSLQEEKARASQALEKIFHSDKKRYDVEIVKPSGNKLTAEEREAVLSTKKQPGELVLPVRDNRRFISEKEKSFKPIEIFTVGKKEDPLLIKATPVREGRSGKISIVGDSGARSREVQSGLMAERDLGEQLSSRIVKPGEPKPKPSAKLVNPNSRKLSEEESRIVTDLTREKYSAREDLPVFSVAKEGRVALATKAKADVASNVRGSVDEVMAKYGNESFSEPLGENDFIEASYGVGSGTKGALADEAGDYLGKGRPYQPDAIESGWKAKSERAKLLEFLPRQDYIEGRVFSDTEAQALVTAENSVDGLSFKSGNGKKFRPTDQATADFLGAFDNRKELSQEQIVRLAAGLKTPIKVNGVDISPHSRVPKNPEGGMTTGKAALALTAAGAIGMGVMNGGSSGLAEKLRDAVIMQESSGKSGAISYDKNGKPLAKGLMQLLDSTGKEMHKKLGIEEPYNPFNPEQNKKIGTAYLAELLKQFNNDPELALTAYHSGPGRVSKLLKMTKGASLSDIMKIPLTKGGLGPVGRAYAKSVLKKYSGEK